MLEPGQVVDRYTVDRVLGRGGMAVVYRVRHNQLASWHALKVLTIGGRSIQERLLQEGRVQAALRHPNIVAVTDVLELDGSPGLVMEYIEGPALDDWLNANQPDLQQAEAIFRAIVDAVGHAHSQGVVHRDLKPANVMLAPATNGFIPKVADFGLAKLVEGDGALGRTRSGVTMGTPAYMAPEQIRDAKNVDARADMFSLGCILFELTCGRPPFTGPDVLSIFNAVASASFPPPLSLVPDLPARLHDAILGLLVVDRDRRIPDGPTLLQILNGGSFQPQALPHSFSGQAPAESQRTWSASMAPDVGQASGSGSVGGVHQVASVSVPRSAAPASAARSGPDGSLAAPSVSGSLSASRASQSPRRRRGLLALGVGGGGIAVLGVVLLVAAGALAVGVGWGAERYYEGQARRALYRGTDDQVRFESLRVRPGGVTLTGLRVVGRDGEPVARAESLLLRGSPTALRADTWELAAVELSGVQLSLREDDEGWVWPADAVAFARGEGAWGLPEIHAGEVATGPVEVEVHTVSGTLEASWDELTLADAVLGDGAPRAASGRVDAVSLHAGEPVFDAASVELTGGEARVEGLEAWVRLRSDGYLDVPYAVEHAFPGWLGGTAEVPVAWPQRLVDGLPVPTDRLLAAGEVHVLDRAHAARSVQWELELERLSVGPRGTTLPVRAEGQAAGAHVDVVLDLSREASTGRVSVQGLPLERLRPYLEPSLREYRVLLNGGTASLGVDLSSEGPRLQVGTDGRVDGPVFSAAPDGPSRSGRRLLKARDTVPVVSVVGGSVEQRHFAPTEAILRAVADATFAPAGGAVWPERVVSEPRRSRHRPRPVTRPVSPEPAAPPDEPAAPPDEPPAEVAPTDPPAGVGGSWKMGEPTPADPASAAPAEAAPEDDQPRGRWEIHGGRGWKEALGMPGTREGDGADEGSGD